MSLMMFPVRSNRISSSKNRISPVRQKEIDIENYIIEKGIIIKQDIIDRPVDTYTFIPNKYFNKSYWWMFESSKKRKRLELAKENNDIYTATKKYLPIDISQIKYEYYFGEHTQDLTTRELQNEDLKYRAYSTSNKLKLIDETRTGGYKFKITYWYKKTTIEIRK